MSETRLYLAGGARLFLFLLASTAFSQEALGLRQAVESALASHPLLAAGDGRIGQFQGFQTQSGLRPNPRLILQSENFRSYQLNSFSASRDVDYFAFGQQMFETASKRERRVDLASANRRRAELDRDLLARQIAARVKLSYWQAAGAARAVQLLRENVENFQQVVEYHEIRVREGAMAEADLLKVRLEAERLAVAANAAALDAERARIQLFRDMGQTSFPAVRFTESLEDDGSSILLDGATAVEDRVEGKIARQLLEQSAANLRLQQANARPDVDVVLGYKRTAGYDTLIGGMQWNVPLFSRNQGNIAAAAAEGRVAQSEMRAAEALIRAEVAAAQADVTIRRRQIREVFRGLLDRAAESSRIAQAAYREGGSDLLRLLDAERVRIEMQLLYYRTLTEYHQSLTSLEFAVGMAP